MLCPHCARHAGASDRAHVGGLAIHSCFPYAGALREAIVAFKRGRRAFAPDLAALLEPSIDSRLALVPIPTTQRRRVERGFDQTVLLARILQRRRGAQVTDVLIRCGAAQQGRTRAQRLGATGRFRVRSGARASAAGVILFDDVRTTGATLIDAARTLESAGWTVASALTLAWTPPKST